MTTHTPRDEQDASTIIREAAAKGTLLNLAGNGTKALDGAAEPDRRLDLVGGHDAASRSTSRPSW